MLLSSLLTSAQVLVLVGAPVEWPLLPEASANSRYYSIQAPSETTGVPIRFTAGMSGVQLRDTETPYNFSTLGTALELSDNDILSLGTSFSTVVDLEASTTPVAGTVGYQRILGKSLGLRVEGAYAANFSGEVSGEPWWRGEGGLWFATNAGPLDFALNTGVGIRTAPTNLGREDDQMWVQGVGLGYRVGGALDRIFAEGRADILQDRPARLVSVGGLEWKAGDLIKFSTAASYNQSELGDSWGVMLGLKAAAGGADADDDGVDIRYDACPTNAGDIDLLGCQPEDADEDGVDDFYDACPEAPGTIRNSGCPEPDSNNDGKADADEKCLGARKCG